MVWALAETCSTTFALRVRQEERQRPMQRRSGPLLFRLLVLGGKPPRLAQALQARVDFVEALVDIGEAAIDGLRHLPVRAE